MKKLILISTFFLLTPLLLAQTGIRIGPGAHLTGDGGSIIVISNAGLINNGEFQALDNKVIITGTASTNQTVLGGANTIYLDELEVNKSANDLKLTTDIEVSTKLKMTSGSVLLNNNDITLSDPSAFVEGETESKRISGTTGGEIIIFTTLNSPVAANPGNLGAEISAPGNLGSVEIRRGHLQQTTLDGGISIQRYFDILPANNANLDANLRFHYLDAESAGVPESEYELYRFHGGAWQPQNVGFGAADPDMTADWIQKTGIPAFSRWTVGSSVNNVLPVELLFFSSRCEGDFTLLEFATATETNSAYFTIDWSLDGHIWSELTKIEATGNSTETTFYSYLDPRRIDEAVYYRLSETGLSGSQEYLKITSANCYQGGDSDISIYPNPILAGTNLYLNFSNNKELPALQIEIFNATGQSVYSGEINVNENSLISFPMPKVLASGHYLLHLIDVESGWKHVKKIEVVNN